MWPHWSVGRDSLGGDLAFLNYGLNYTRRIVAQNGYIVSELPAAAPQKIGGDRAALFVCSGPYTKGWYQLGQLTLPSLRPGRAPKREAKLGSMAEESPQADYIVLDTRCQKEKPSNEFIRGSTRGSLELYVRDQRRSPKR
jgi:hypothetical protein